MDTCTPLMSACLYITNNTKTASNKAPTTVYVVISASIAVLLVAAIIVHKYRQGKKDSQANNEYHLMPPLDIRA
jgi:hypothetical protein